jgi:hypothetical protein
MVNQKIKVNQSVDPFRQTFWLTAPNTRLLLQTYIYISKDRADAPKTSRRHACAWLHKYTPLNLDSLSRFLFSACLEKTTIERLRIRYSACAAERKRFRDLLWFY